MSHSILTLIVVAVLLYFAIRRVQHRYAETSLPKRLSFGRTERGGED